MGSRLKVKFWGTRGLISAPGPEQLKYGGNTPCIQVIHKNHVILVDTGFGVCNLGEQLLPRLMQGEKMTCHIFYTHFHWDHVQGLPFFHPVYFPNATVKLYAPVPRELMHRNLDLLFDGSYSPFSGIDSMPAKIELLPIAAPVVIDDLSVAFCPTDHGKGQHCETFAYMITDCEGARRVAVISDHEARSSEKNVELVRFAQNADLLIHDAQYTDREYVGRVGWGHSSIRMALENAKRMRAQYVLLTHHDPGRRDEDIDRIYNEFKSSPEFKVLNFDFAKEEDIYEVQGSD